MEYITRAQIGLAPPHKSTRMSWPDGWVVHWVGGAGLPQSPTLQQSIMLMRSLQADAFNRGYADFEYNWAVDPAGRILEGRGWDVVNGANGTTSSNAHGIAVVSLAGPGVRLTNEEKGALLTLTQEGARRYAAVSYVKPHRAVLGVSTQCPGDERAAFCPTLQANLHGVHPVPPMSTGDEDLFIEAPAKYQLNPNRKAGAWLDKAAKQVWLENGAKTKEPALYGVVIGVPAHGDVVGWAPEPGGFYVVGKPIDNSGAPTFHYHWA